MAQGRNRQWNYREPVIQVLAKTAFLPLEHFKSLLVATSNRTSVCRGLLNPSRVTKPSVNTRNSLACAGSDISAACIDVVCCFENALARTMRFGERSPFVSEQLSFREAFR